MSKLSGVIDAAYASELDTLCNVIPLGALTAKPEPVEDAHLEAFLRSQLVTATQPRTRSLITVALTTPLRQRGAVLRRAFVDEAKPLLPTTLGADPSAPTAPWGKDEPTPRTNWDCRLADRFDKLAP